MPNSPHAVATSTVLSKQQKADSTHAVIISQSDIKDQFFSMLYYCQEFYNIEPQKTLEYAQLGLAYAEKTNDSLSIALMFNALGRARYRLGHLEVALINLKKSLALSTMRKDSSHMAVVSRSLSAYYQTTGELDEARLHAKRAIDIGKKVGDVLTVMQAMHSYAVSYQGNGDYLRSLELYYELMTYCEENKLDCRGSKVNMARALHNIGDISEAIDLFFEVKSEFLSTGNHREVAAIEHHIGYILKLTGIYEEALFYYSRVNEYFSEHYDVNQLSIINENLGELMMSLNKPDEAEAYLKKCLTMKRESGIKSIGVVLQSIGLNFLNQSAFDSAYLYFDQSLQVFQQLDDYKGEASIYNDLAGFYLSKGELNLSLKYARSARALNKKYGLKRALFESYEHLSASFEQLSQFDSALFTKHQAEALRAELSGPEELLKITKKVVTEKLKNSENVPIAQNKLLEELLKDDSHNTKVLDAKWVYNGLIAVLIVGGLIFFLRKKNVRDLKPNVPRKSNTLSPEEAAYLVEKLKDIMTVEKLFLNKNLTLKNLADRLEISDKKLSILLNYYLKTNFYDYLNKLRIETFIEELKENRNKQFSIVGLASQSGFKSKSSFYRIFNKEVGMSPSAFIEGFEKEEHNS